VATYWLFDSTESLKLISRFILPRWEEAHQRKSDYANPEGY
jgi:hypothetical protein